MIGKPRNATVHNGTPTSKAAGDRIRMAANGQRLQVLNYIRKQGDRGATDKEIQAALNIVGDTERPRRRELQQAGMITAAEETRDGCKVWLFVEPAAGQTISSGSREQPLDTVSEKCQRREQRRRQVEADRRETARLEADHGERLDAMTLAELQDLFTAEPDTASRDALQSRTERFGRNSSFVRRRLLTLLQQQSLSGCEH